MSSQTSNRTEKINNSFYGVSRLTLSHNPVNKKLINCHICQLKNVGDGAPIDCHIACWDHQMNLAFPGSISDEAYLNFARNCLLPSAIDRASYFITTVTNRDVRSFMGSFYLAEIEHENYYPEFYCSLCNVKKAAGGIIDHLASVGHGEHFLVSF